MTDRRVQSLPVRDTLRDYSRDSYVRGGSRSGACDTTPDLATHVIDCASGVFEFEPSALVVRALGEIDVHRLAAYTPLAVESRLKQAILHRFRTPGVGDHQLFLGHGSFNLLERIIHKVLRPTVLVGVGPQFSEVPSEFLAAGGRYQSFPLAAPDASLPLAALESALGAGGLSAVYLDNPNNPLGRTFDLETIDRLASSCDRSAAALLVDEAFGDYVDDEKSAIQLLPRHRNLIVVRSFSKALGLAAERIGYVFMSTDMAKRYREIDVPFEPGLVAQTLAVAAMSDHGWIERVRVDARQAKARIVAALADTGVQVLPTHPDVAIMALHRPGHDLWCELRTQGIVALAGSSFARTHADWDDSYCRLRVMRGDQLDLLCSKLAAL